LYFEIRNRSADEMAALKLAIAGVYSNYTSEIVDAEGIEQAEGFSAGPVGGKLLLQYRRA